MEQTIVIDKRFERPQGSSNEGYAAGLMSMLVAGGLRILAEGGVPGSSPIRLENGRGEPRDQPSRACTYQRVDEVCCGIAVRTRVC
jgi:hypothetical protein